MTDSSLPLLIVGASVRAAAASAIRAGFQPICADRFGDEDLRRIGCVLTVGNDRQSLLKAIDSIPPCPWIYTGSIENDPRLIAAISRKHFLLGNPPEVLKQVRDPFWLERTLQVNDLPALRHRRATDPPHAQDRKERLMKSTIHVRRCGSISDATEWLLKPIQSGGGHRIVNWAGQAVPTTSRSYFQERRRGVPMSALFIAERKQVRMVGICEQLIGFAANAPTEFAYAGSIGPLELERSASDVIGRIGDVVAREGNLRGLFGIDFVLAEDVPWVVEVNPRYTASVEILERATESSLVSSHISACRTFKETGVRSSLTLPSSDHRRMDSVRTIDGPLQRLFGKQIIYAPQALIAPALEDLFDLEGHCAESPLIADIPAPGSQITAGLPICTVFAEGTETGECRRKLGWRAQQVIKAAKALPPPKTADAL